MRRTGLRPGQQMSTETNSESALLTSKEVAQLIHVSARRLLEQARRGEIPHYRLGGRRFFRLAEVLDAMRVERVASVAEILR